MAGWCGMGGRAERGGLKPKNRYSLKGPLLRKKRFAGKWLVPRSALFESGTRLSPVRFGPT